MIVARLDTSGLDKILAEMEPRAREIVKGAAFEVEAKAKTLAPVDTGALRNSIETEQAGNLTWQVHDGVEYGLWQEIGFHHFGSGKFIQNAFMVPAVEAVRPEWEQKWSALFNV